MSKALARGDLWVRCQIAHELWQIDKNPAALEVLRESLKQHSSLGALSYRWTVEFLGEMGSAAKPALPELEKLYGEADAVIQEAVRAAIRKIDPDAEIKLKQMKPLRQGSSIWIAPIHLAKDSRSP